MAANAIYENVQKEVDDFLDANKDDQEQFAEFLTAFFLMGKKESDFRNCSECIKMIMADIYSLKEEEIERRCFQGNPLQ